MVANEETLRAKLEKLLRLAGQNASPEEAASAASMAQAMAFKYNIDLEGVRNQMGSQAKSFSEYKKGTVNLGRKGMTTWHMWLYATICETNFCKLVILAGLGRDRCKYGEAFGEPHNLEVVAYLYEYLEKEIRRLGKAAWQVEQYRTSESERVWFRSYCHGACVTIMDRLKAQRRKSEVEVASTGGTGIVRMTEAKLLAAYQEAYVSLRKGRKSKQAENGEAYWQGRRDAHDIAINPALKDEDE